MSTNNNQFIFELEDIIKERLTEGSDKSYTYKLMQDGINQVAKKVIEESSEFAIASIQKKNDTKDIVWEAADLMYHFLILLNASGVTLNEVFKELENRNKG
ncbi:phosphoribosyl-ATP diphosphatase [Gammaproteobacteria bacterium]|jgi:phosphoribosyl-ATP pyrophosphohydrolase|nr:phosphoribosyl-ATP diphosphatase [Gammaproteobacteria bacterium]|tara:strand:- start:531 stop:833 length:303 start_codon:yes stop_codon:yes gene_type:complete